MSKKSGPKKPVIDEADLAIFHRAMAGTKVLTHKKVGLKRQSQQPSSQSTPKPHQHTIEQQSLLCCDENAALKPVRGDESIAYKQIGISHKILRKLRKGQYNVDATLDLHGMTVEDTK